MKKVAVFPYDLYFSPILKNQNLLNDIEIIQIFSLKGWGFVGESLAFSNKDEFMSDKVISDIMDENITFDFDTLWIVGSNNHLDESYLYNVIEIMAKKNINIMVSKVLNNDQISKIQQICQIEQANVEFIKNSEIEISDTNEIIYPIGKPIISVSGLDIKTNKFELQLELKSRLEKDGYNVALISSRSECFLINEHPLPSFLSSNEISEKTKILMFNHLIKMISNDDNVDVIIVGVPSGVMPNSKLQVANFGITAFHIFNAVSPDFNIFSIHCNGNNDKYLDELYQLMKYKFSIEIDCFNLSNIAQDPFSVNKLTDIEYILYNNDYPKEEISKLEYKKCPLFERRSYENMYNFLINQLSSYDDLEVL